MKKNIRLSNLKSLVKIRTRMRVQALMNPATRKKKACFPYISETVITHLATETTEVIEDRTETNLVNLRRIIYLTIMNALNYEEAVHKLLKVQLQEGQEVCGS
jgi:hypothetical protein